MYRRCFYHTLPSVFLRLCCCFTTTSTTRITTTNPPYYLCCHALTSTTTRSSFARTRPRGPLFPSSPTGTTHNHTTKTNTLYTPQHNQVRYYFSSNDDDDDDDDDGENNNSKTQMKKKNKEKEEEEITTKEEEKMITTTMPKMDWSKLTVMQLKAELKARGLKRTGRKAELIVLLERDDEDDDDENQNKNNPHTDRSSSTTTTATTTMTTTDAIQPIQTIAARKRQATASSTQTQTKTKMKKQDHQRITDSDILPKLWTEEMAKANGSYTFKIASWNVAGLRGLLRKEGANVLQEFCTTYQLDMLCLQETKLQELHVEDPKLNFRTGLIPGYTSYWSCSTTKKGYSGTCVFIKEPPHQQQQQQSEPKDRSNNPTSNKHRNTKTSIIDPALLVPTKIDYTLGDPQIDDLNEGRYIAVTFPWATITNVYVPNSGQNLQRLQYRTEIWDPIFGTCMRQQQQLQKNEGSSSSNISGGTTTLHPVIWLGDLNIAHQSYDIWNDGAKHLSKQAGVTEQERASFTHQLRTGNRYSGHEDKNDNQDEDDDATAAAADMFVDVFRRLHPNAKGNYSYWSQRAGNRIPNKGLRLDYFIASNTIMANDDIVTTTTTTTTTSNNSNDDDYDDDDGSSRKTSTANTKVNVIARDSYMIMDQMGSDHAPVILELELKEN